MSSASNSFGNEVTNYIHFVEVSRKVKNRIDLTASEAIFYKNFQVDKRIYDQLMSESTEFDNTVNNKRIIVNIHTGGGFAGHVSLTYEDPQDDGTYILKYNFGLDPAVEFGKGDYGSLATSLRNYDAPLTAEVVHIVSEIRRVLTGTPGAFTSQERPKDDKHLLQIVRNVPEELAKIIAQNLRKKEKNPPDYYLSGKNPNSCTIENNCIAGLDDTLKQGGIIEGLGFFLTGLETYEALNNLDWRPVLIPLKGYMRDDAHYAWMNSIGKKQLQEAGLPVDVQSTIMQAVEKGYQHKKDESERIQRDAGFNLIFSDITPYKIPSIPDYTQSSSGYFSNDEICHRQLMEMVRSSVDETKVDPQSYGKVFDSLELAFIEYQRNKQYPPTDPSNSATESYSDPTYPSMSDAKHYSTQERHAIQASAMQTGNSINLRPDPKCTTENKNQHLTMGTNTPYGRVEVGTDHRTIEEHIYKLERMVRKKVRRGVKTIVKKIAHAVSPNERRKDDIKHVIKSEDFEAVTQIFHSAMAANDQQYQDHKSAAYLTNRRNILTIYVNYLKEIKPPAIDEVKVDSNGEVKHDKHGAHKLKYEDSNQYWEKKAGQNKWTLELNQADKDLPIAVAKDIEKIKLSKINKIVDDINSQAKQLEIEMNNHQQQNIIFYKIKVLSKIASLFAQVGIINDPAILGGIDIFEGLILDPLHEMGTRNLETLNAIRESITQLTTEYEVLYPKNDLDVFYGVITKIKELNDELNTLEDMQFTSSQIAKASVGASRVIGRFAGINFNTLFDGINWSDKGIWERCKYIGKLGVHVTHDVADTYQAANGIYGSIIKTDAANFANPVFAIPKLTALLNKYSGSTLSNIPIIDVCDRWVRIIASEPIGAGITIMDTACDIAGFLGFTLVSQPALFAILPLRVLVKISNLCSAKIAFEEHISDTELHHEIYKISYQFFEDLRNAKRLPGMDNELSVLAEFDQEYSRKYENVVNNYLLDAANAVVKIMMNHTPKQRVKEAANNFREAEGYLNSRYSPSSYWLAPSRERATQEHLAKLLLIDEMLRIYRTSLFEYSISGQFKPLEDKYVEMRGRLNTIHASIMEDINGYSDDAIVKLTKLDLEFKRSNDDYTGFLRGIANLDQNLPAHSDKEKVIRNLNSVAFRDLLSQDIFIADITLRVAMLVMEQVDSPARWYHSANILQNIAQLGNSYLLAGSRIELILPIIGFLSDTCRSAYVFANDTAHLHTDHTERWVPTFNLIGTGVDIGLFAFAKASGVRSLIASQALLSTNALRELPPNLLLGLNLMVPAAAEYIPKVLTMQHGLALQCRLALSASAHTLRSNRMTWIYMLTLKANIILSIIMNNVIHNPRLRGNVTPQISVTLMSLMAAVTQFSALDLASTLFRIQWLESVAIDFNFYYAYEAYLEKIASSIEMVDRGLRGEAEQQITAICRNIESLTAPNLTFAAEYPFLAYLQNQPGKTHEIQQLLSKCRAAIIQVKNQAHGSMPSQASRLTSPFDIIFKLLSNIHQYISNFSNESNQNNTSLMQTDLKYNNISFSMNTTYELHPVTHEPIWTVNGYTETGHQRIFFGSAKLYGTPIVCRSADSTQLNLIQVTGAFNDFIQSVDRSQIENICKVLPPSKYAMLFSSIRSGATLGACHSVGKIAESVLSSRPSATFALCAGKVLQYGCYYAAEFYFNLRDPSDWLTPATEALTKTATLAVFDLGLSLASKVCGWASEKSAEKKIRCAPSVFGFFKHVDKGVPACLLAYEAYRAGPADAVSNTFASVVPSILVEKSLYYGASKLGIKIKHP
jgi:hypothetical protein